MKKKWILAVAVLLVVVAAAAAAFKLGLFVYPYSMDKLNEIQTYDLLATQYARELALLEDYQKESYTVGKPYTAIDPYDFNPLSALVMFEIGEDCAVEVSVQGDDPYATYTYTHQAKVPRAEVPVLGLYAGRENTVTIAAGGKITELKITTGPLPEDMPDYVLEVSKPEQMAKGVTLLTPLTESYTVLLDNNAQVRGYLSNKRMAHGTSTIILENGNILSVGDEYRQIPYYMANLFEHNWLGKIYRIYDIPNSVHHCMTEMPDGDILAVTNHEFMAQTGTREDMVLRADRKTGQIKKLYDFREIIDEKREPYHHFQPGVDNFPNNDWMHTNAVAYDSARNAVIVSAAIQSMVISIDADSSEINWILGPHDGYNDELKQYLLTPIGDNFEWQWCQHCPVLLENDDPDLIDILLLDNGSTKSFYEASAVPAAENYSRAVIYQINLKDRTVRQLWQYGKERGTECYSTYIGGVQWLGGNVLANFGGMVFEDGAPSNNLAASVLGGLVTRARIVEVTKEGEEVYEISVHETPFTEDAGIYRALRIPLFMAASYQTLLGQDKGERVGRSNLCGPPAGEFEDFSVPPIYIGKLSAEFTVIRREGDRLILDGTLLNKGTPRILSRAFVILKGKQEARVFETNTGLYGRFFLSVDLSKLPAGEYQIAVAGATVEGNDALGKRSVGHFKTEYKVTVTVE